MALTPSCRLTGSVALPIVFQVGLGAEFRDLSVGTVDDAPTLREVGDVGHASFDPATLLPVWAMPEPEDALTKDELVPMVRGPLEFPALSTLVE